MTDPIRSETRGALGVIHMQAGPVNALGHGLRVAIGAAHAAFCADPAIRAIALAGQPRFFSAGADIREFDSGRKAPLLTDLIAQIETADKPTLALVGGVCFGGGFELALACDRRLAMDGARFAFPEIRLGNIPGAGGTQKLPRLVGGPAALDIITTAREIGAAEAVGLGLCEGVFPDTQSAMRRAEELALRGLDRVSLSLVQVPGDPSDLDAPAAAALRKARGAQAVASVVEGLRNAHAMPLSEGLAWERETFAALNASAEAKAQRHVFFAERAARKLPDLPSGTAERRIAQAAVIGAGTMGAGIAMCFAEAGLPVVLIDTDAAQLGAACERIADLWGRARDKGRISADAVAARLALLTTARDLKAAAGADIVVEAVFEALALKQEIFAALDCICKPGAVLATNTSTLDVDRIAAATARPADVIGLHFFSPANVMSLLEVVRGAASAPDVIATAMGLAQRLGKQPVLVGVCDGFVGNRMFINFNREAQLLVEQGATPEQVDRVLTGFGLAMGPFAVMDLAGLDVGYRIRQARAEVSGRPALYPFTAADRLAEMGRLGQKTGAGWYSYADGSRKGRPDPQVAEVIAQVAREKGQERRSLPDAEIRRRCLWQLVNTGARILQEGIARSPGDIDVIFVHGYGFPRLAGGPMFHAETVGLGRVLADIKEFHAAFGDHWAPAPLLERAVAEGLCLSAAAGRAGG